jgi:hypothetical protein
LGGLLWRDPALTYRGALQIIGRHDRPVIEKLDRLLGGFILGGGAIGAAAAVNPALAPLAAFAAAWGWIEPKNEAIKLLSRAVDSVSDKLMRLGGYERYQLIAAAHTTLVVAAFFEVLKEQLGTKDYKELAITESERESLAFGSSHDLTNRRLIEVLYSAPVPAPSPGRGFEETIPEIQAWMTEIATTIQRFLNGLASWRTIKRPLVSGVLVQRAVERYRSHYIKMAATVPEFWVWANLGEHAATRDKVTDTREKVIECRADVLSALKGQAGALARLENLLSLTAPRSVPGRNLCDIVNRANLGTLTESVVPEDAIARVADVTFPTVEEIFLNPRYRLAPMGDDARPADDKWWESRELYNDLDLMVAGHVTAPDAVHAPLLLLGHPGAGKSLLTKVIAARLPTSAFTVIRVSLRRVHADAPVYEQIQEALNTATNGRVNWYELAEQSSSTLRVVLLDGLDELLQAAGHRGGYLQDVADFQRREAEQQRPVVVLITSRTVVADRFAIPLGTTIIKLEDFSQGQIAAWVSKWNSVNKRAISTGAVRGLSVEAALHQLDLAKQPLLLLMLALYSADPGSPDIDSTLSSADLYRRIIDNFSRREVAKSVINSRSHEFEDAVRDQLWRLSVVAFAMFNRGRQSVTDDELGDDLRALNPDITPLRPGDLGRQLIGQFFFVYVAEARPHDSEDKRRSYEFLHATFGEYFIASYVVSLLTDIVNMAMSAGNTAYQPDDQLLYTLLCHQALASRKTTLSFAGQLAEEFSFEKRTRVLSLLDSLIAKCRRRHTSDRYSRYDPLQIDHVRQLAAYSANLVLLRVTLDDGHGFHLSSIWDDGNSAEMWRSTVTHWRSSLEPDEFQAILSTLKREGKFIRLLRPEEIMPTEWVDLSQARLVGDRELESRLRFGMAIYDRALYSDGSDAWKDVVISTLVPAISLPDADVSMLLSLPDGRSIAIVSGNESGPGFDNYQIEDILQMSSRLLFLRSGALPRETVKRIIEWILDLPGEEYRQYSYVSYGFASAIAAHPELLDTIPALNDASLYESGAPLILSLSQSRTNTGVISLIGRIRRYHHRGNENDYYISDHLREVIGSILTAYRFESSSSPWSRQHR